MFFIYLRTNSDLCYLQDKLIGFYNRDEKCLLRGRSFVMTMKAPRSFETSVIIYQCAWCNIIDAWSSVRMFLRNVGGFPHLPEYTVSCTKTAVWISCDAAGQRAGIML